MQEKAGEDSKDAVNGANDDQVRMCSYWLVTLSSKWSMLIRWRLVADRKSTRLNSSHSQQSRMPSSA